MTEENAGHGNAGMPEVPPAGESGERSIPAVPPGVPPRPSTPPPSATDFTPAAPVRPSVPPVSRAGGRSARSGSRSGWSGSAGTAASGAGRLVSARAARLGGWVRRQGLARSGAAAAAVVLLGLLLWWLTSLGGGAKPSAADSSQAPAAALPSAPASRGPLPLDGVGAMDFQLGDCFKDFDAEAPTSTVVDCATGHSAQLVAIERYAAADSYPGRDPLKQKALDACKAAPLTEKQADYALSYKLAYPSSTSWDKGDRRVDCYATAGAGNSIAGTLLP